MSRVIQVFEFEKLTLHLDWRGRQLMPRELERLLEYNDNNNNKYFIAIRDGIQFNNYVGVIQIGSLTIEILPKTDKLRSSDKDFINWHGALLNMLKICKHINVNSVSEANLKQKNNSLLELYFEIFLEEVEFLLRKGLIKQYRIQSSNVLSLKGRLDFNKNIQNNFIHQERFYTEHQTYDFENLANQILLKGLNILGDFSFKTSIKDKIARLKTSFPEIKEISIQKNHFDKLKENRKFVAYNQALQIAKMIILNYSPDIRTGQENMLTLLFDMNKLWEEYIYRMLNKANLGEYKIEFQNSQFFWENKTIRPDLVITKNTNEIYVIDTKWKIIDHRNPSDEDLKQMYAYNIYWNAKKSMLLYPKVFDFPEKFGTFHKGKIDGNDCKLGFVNVLDEAGKLDLEIGKRVLEKFM